MKRQLIHEQIHYWLLLAIAVTMPFSIKLNSILIIASLVNHIAEGKLLFYLKSTWKNTVNRYIILFFALHVFSIAFSSDLTEAGAIMERRLVLLVFPLVLFKPLTNQQYKAVEYAFVGGVIAGLSYCLAGSIYKYQLSGQTDVFFYHTLSEQIGVSANYLSAYVVFSVFILMHFFKAEQTATQKWLVAVLVFLVIAVLLLSSKMMLFVLFVGVLYQLSSSYAIGKLQKGIVVAFLVVVAAIAISTPQIRQRFSLELASNFSVVNQTSYRYDTPFTGTTLRLTIWKYCYQILKRENAWLTGVGTGDFQQLLNEEYKRVNMYTGNPELKDTGYLGYGPHNQYIETVFVLGFIGLLVFILLLFKQLLQAFHSGNKMFVLFMVLHLLFFITESALSTNKGVVFYAFFSLIFNIQTTFQSKEASIS